jgi:hypothetical protein
MLEDEGDDASRKYGKHTVFLAFSAAAIRGSQHAGDRAELPRRQDSRFKGEDARKRLGMPWLGEVS